MERCHSCSAPLQPDDRFCPSCGAAVEIRREGAWGSASSETSRPFRLSVALPPAMQAGRRSAVVVRFRVADDIYESVEFSLRHGRDELGCMPCCEGRPMSAEHQTSIAVTPKVPGEVKLSLDIRCRVSGADEELSLPAYVETYTADFAVSVEAPRSSAFSPVFNISPTINPGNANDFRDVNNVNVNFGGMQLAQQEDLSRYETAQSSFTTLAARLVASPERLTLKSGDDTLQLLSDDCVTFGRGRDTIVPIRICGSDGRVDRDANRINGGYVVSRRHFAIFLSGDDCIVRDGIDGEASANGTAVDGEKLPPKGAARLCAGKAAEICVGRDFMKMRVTFRRDSWDRAAGFVLDRLDGARQRVCAVWREMPLCGGVRVSWTGSVWMLFNGSSESVPLAVGSKVSIGGRRYTVLPFRKTHLK